MTCQCYRVTDERSIGADSIRDMAAQMASVSEMATDRSSLVLEETKRPTEAVLNKPAPSDASTTNS